MKLKVALMVSALYAAAVVPAHAGNQRSVDARTFDVAGVKTGMDFNEARAAAAKHFQVPENQIKAGSLYLNPVTNTQLPNTLSYDKNGVRFLIHFEGRVPKDPKRPLVASQIRYEIPWTSENKDAMGKAALAKYGKQSNYPNDLVLEWCATPSSNSGIGCPGALTEAVLKYSGVGIELVDPAWINARIKFVDQLKSTKPGF